MVTERRKDKEGQSQEVDSKIFEVQDQPMYHKIKQQNQLK